MQTESYRDRNSGRIGSYAEDFARFYPQLERVEDDAVEPEETDGNVETPEGDEKTSATAPTPKPKGAAGADKES